MQLKHLLGGIQAEKDASVVFLENQQKKIVKAMEKFVANHQKIHQALVVVKECLVEMTDQYSALAKEMKSSELLLRLLNQANRFFSEISEESLALSRKMENKISIFLPRLKKTKDNYHNRAETLQHYKEKLQLLEKGIKKQGAGNVSYEQFERVNRNKEKLKQAENQYGSLLEKVLKTFMEFNKQGTASIAYDLISMFATFSGSIISSNFCLKDLLKDIGQNNKLQKEESSNSAAKMQLNGWPSVADSSQISHFIRVNLEKDLDKSVQRPLPISSRFMAGTGKGFTSFENNYSNNQERSINYKSSSSQTTPVKNSIDLLNINNQPVKNMKLSDPCQAKKNTQKQFQKMLTISLSHSQSAVQVKPKISSDKKKQNLQKFNQLCFEKMKDSSKHQILSKNERNAKQVDSKIGHQLTSLAFFDIKQPTIIEKSPRNLKAQEVQFPSFAQFLAHPVTKAINGIKPPAMTQQKICSPLSSTTIKNSIKFPPTNPNNQVKTDNRFTQFANLLGL